MKTNGDIKKYYQYAFPMQAALLTCNDEKGKTNIITVAWHTPISREPPLYGVSIAPKRYSHDLILKNKEFVVNFAPYNLVKQVHFCGVHTGKNTDKVKETKLTLIPAQKVKVPIIKECYAHLECKLANILSIGDHDLFAGEVLNVQADENVFQKNLLDIRKTQPLYYIGENKYTTINGKEETNL